MQRFPVPVSVTQTLIRGVPVPVTQTLIRGVRVPVTVVVTLPGGVVTQILVDQASTATTTPSAVRTTPSTVRTTPSTVRTTTSTKPIEPSTPTATAVSSRRSSSTSPVVKIAEATSTPDVAAGKPQDALIQSGGAPAVQKRDMTEGAIKQHIKESRITSSTRRIILDRFQNILKRRQRKMQTPSSTETLCRDKRRCKLPCIRPRIATVTTNFVPRTLLNTRTRSFQLPRKFMPLSKNGFINEGNFSFLSARYLGEFDHVNRRTNRLMPVQHIYIVPAMISTYIHSNA